MENEQPQNDTQPEAPQPPVDQHPSSTADSESTGGSSPEPAEEGVEEAPAVEQEAIVPGDLRPAQGATNPKTAPVPPAFPLEPVNVKPSRGPVATRPSSRIKEAQRNKKAQRDASVGIS